ncbi:MAG: hypothetical protein AB1445_11930 [Bacillota bacterium]
MNFRDTALVYQSHPQVAQGLARVPRHQVLIASQTRALGATEAELELDGILDELSTPYLDIVLRTT